MKKIKVFISYQWDYAEIAEKILDIMKNFGFIVTKDNPSLNYKDDIKMFMESVVDHDFTLILFSEKYFRSRNCVFELMRALGDSGNSNKILPIAVDDISFSILQISEIMKHWQNCLKSEIDSIKKLENFSNVEKLIELHKITKEIEAKLPDILILISNQKYIVYLGDETDWNPLIEYIKKQQLEFDTEKLSQIAKVSKIKNYEEKIEKIKELQFNYKEDNELLNLEANVHQNFKEYKLAKKIMEVLLTREPNNLDYKNNLSLILISLGENFQLAESLLVEISEKDNSNTNYMLNLANFLWTNKKDFFKAKTYYERAFMLKPEDPMVCFSLGLFYISSNFNLSKGGELLEKAFIILPDKEEFVLNYSYFLYVHERNIKKAINILETVIEKSSNPIIYNNFGIYNFEIKNYEIAFRSYLKTIEIDRNYSSAYLGLGHIYKTYFNELALAEQYYLKAIELEPNKAEYYYNFGLLKYDLKDYDEALLLFEKTLLFDENYNPAKDMKALTLGFHLNDKETAIQLLNEIISENQDIARALYNKALLSEKDDPVESINCLERILQQNTNDVEVLKKIKLLAFSTKSQEEYSVYVKEFNRKFPHIQI